MTDCCMCKSPLTKSQITKGQKTCSRECYREYISSSKYNLSFLDDRNEFKYYFLGVWTAIGNINKKEGRIRLESSNKELIDILVKYTKYKNKIEINSREGKKTTYSISFSGKLSRYIQDIGYTPGKKKGKEHFPEEVRNDAEMLAHFLRGLFDARNSIVYEENQKYLLFHTSYANKAFVEEMQAYLKKYANISDVVLIKNHKKESYRLALYHKDTVSICNFIYKRASIKTTKQYVAYLEHKDQKLGRDYVHGYDTDFLDNNTEFCAYFIGLFVTDGHMLKKQNQITLSLTDKQIIYDIAKEINYVNEIGKNYGKGNRKVKYVLNIDGPPVQKLLEMGFRHGRKTGYEHVPQMFKNENFRHFLRGVSDGDGSFYIDKQSKSLRFSLPCVNLKFLKDIHEELRKRKIVYGGSFSETKRKNEILHSLEYGLNDSVSLGKYIYKDATIGLGRKYLVFDEGSQRKIERVIQKGKICKIEGCNLPCRCKELCTKHYNKEYCKKPERKEYMRKYLKEYKKRKKMEKGE